MPRKSRLSAPEAVLRAARLYLEDGRTLDEIGEEFGVSHTTVARHLRLHGVTLRHRGPRRWGAIVTAPTISLVSLA